MVPVTSPERGSAHRFIGAPVRRTEDARLATGKGQYVADVRLPGEAHVHFVRSPHASARIVSVDLAAARSSPGVVGVFSAADLPEGGDLAAIPLVPITGATPHPPLARGVARFIGEPVVAVVAETLPLACDAAELVQIDYEPLRAVTTIQAALAEGAPRVHDAISGNVAMTARWGGGDVDRAFASAACVVELTVRNGRVAPMPLEPRGGIARFDAATEEYTYWISSQAPHRERTELAEALGIPEGSLRLIAPDVGGGFGAKTCAYQEDVALLLVARLCGRPVRWISTRSEDLQTSMQGRESMLEAAAAFSGEGRLLGLKVQSIFNMGAYLPALALIPPIRAASLVPGAYAVQHVVSEVRCVYTNTAPTGPYRGAGRPEASFVIERLMDLAARDLGLDPTEIRRRNFISPEAFPYRAPTGQVYDSGNYAAALDRMLAMANYTKLRAEQTEARMRGELAGIGLATFIEPSGGTFWEGARVRVERSGDVTISTGAGSHGQGHDTTFAQIVADRLQVPFETIRVRHGDTAATPPGQGSYASRTTALAGSAVFQAAEQASGKARRIAAHLLECAAEDVERRPDGTFGVVGLAGRSVTLRQVAAAAYTGANLPAGEEPGLEATVLYRQAPEMFGFGAYLAVVRVDRDTGAVRVERLVAVDDSGVLVNPLLAEGQVQGGIAQGVGQALLEEVVYDEAGQLTTGSLLDYAVPRADSLPPLELDHLETPTPLNPLGAKGVGEAGTIGAPTAIVNAIVDALTPYGVRHVDMPVTASRVWALLQSGLRLSAR